jgi:hypothetical protein
MPGDCFGKVAAARSFLSLMLFTRVFLALMLTDTFDDCYLRLGFFSLASAFGFLGVKRLVIV